MPFPLKPSMTFEEFRDGVVRHYWTDLAGAIGKSVFKCGRAAELQDDYAKIGSFLTDKAKVEAVLEPLEAEIRSALPRRHQQLPSDYAAVVGQTAAKNKGGADSHLKSDKLLTTALRASEAEAGFNHERIQNGTFFDEAKQARGKLHSTAAIANRQGRLANVGRDKPSDSLSSAVDLARGAPTVLGDLDPLAFNVLLRHGYQFKDVAAGACHGEYTHRLQWHSIIHANLGLANTPLDIFRSLGYMFAMAGRNVPDDGAAQLWMWQAPFDTAETKDDAKRLKTIAHAEHGSVFTCPENMNQSLMKPETSDDIATNKLWCLRVLLKTRWKKRFDETLEPVDPQGAKLVGMQKLLEQQLPGGRTSLGVSSLAKKVDVATGNVVTKKIQTTAQVLNPFTKTMETKKVSSTIQEKEMSSMTMSVQTVRHAGYALVCQLRDDTIR